MAESESKKLMAEQAAASRKKADGARASYQELSSRLQDQSAINKESARTGINTDEIKRIWEGDLARLGADVSGADSQIKSVSAREDAFDLGLAKGKDIIGEGSLGRLSTEVGKVDKRLDETRSADTQDILDRRRKALSGLSPEEMSAQKGQAAEQFGRNEETNRRRLASVQAGLGVRGDTASTQQSQQLSAGQQQRTDFERDMVLANRQIQDVALNAFEGSVKGAEASEQNARMGNVGIEQFNLGQQLKQRELEKFNLEQAAKERFGQISVAFGMTQMASAETAGDKAIAAQYAAAAAKGSGDK